MICGASALAMQVPKVRQPHPDIGCWWTLYDYGLDKVKTWDKDYEHPYPGEAMSATPMSATPISV